MSLKTASGGTVLYDHLFVFSYLLFGCPLYSLLEPPRRDSVSSDFGSSLSVLPTALPHLYGLVHEESYVVIGTEGRYKPCPAGFINLLVSFASSICAITLGHGCSTLA